MKKVIALTMAALFLSAVVATAENVDLVAQ